MTLEENIALVKSIFGDRETISFDAADNLTEILDEASEDALIVLVKEQVKFCHMPAGFRLIRKFGWTSERVASLKQQGAIQC